MYFEEVNLRLILANHDLVRDAFNNFTFLGLIKTIVFGLTNFVFSFLLLASVLKPRFA